MKIQNEHVYFQDEWEHDFLFVHAEIEGSAMCLLWHDLVSANKKLNLNQHCGYVHSDFSDSLLLTSERCMRNCRPYK
jgi:hypothetical protein